jgi:hypothetical protein
MSRPLQCAIPKALSPEAQLSSYLKILPVERRAGMSPLVNQAAAMLEAACSVTIEMTGGVPRMAYCRSFSARHALLACATDVQTTAFLGSSELPWSELQAQGEEYLLRARISNIDPARSLLSGTHAALAAPRGPDDPEMFSALLAAAAAVLPTPFSGRFPQAWVVAMGDGNLIIPVILPPTIKELETGTWEVVPRRPAGTCRAREAHVSVSVETRGEAQMSEGRGAGARLTGSQG